MPELPQNPDGYSALGTFDLGSPTELAAKRLFGNDRGLLYVEFYGPVSLRSVLDWHIAGRIQWADDEAKARVLSAARAEMAGVLSGTSASHAAGGRIGRVISTFFGGAPGVIWILMSAAAIIFAFTIINVTTRGLDRVSRAMDQTDQANRAEDASRAASSKRRIAILDGDRNVLPPSKQPGIERAFFMAARNRYQNDAFAMACIDQINRVDVPSPGVIDVYTTVAPHALRPILSAIMPELFKSEAIIVNTRNAYDGHIVERLTHDPRTGSGNISFP